jgi:hypothetical protein
LRDALSAQLRRENPEAPRPAADKAAETDIPATMAVEDDRNALPIAGRATAGGLLLAGVGLWALGRRPARRQ